MEFFIANASKPIYVLVLFSIIALVTWLTSGYCALRGFSCLDLLSRSGDKIALRYAIFIGGILSLFGLIIIALIAVIYVLLSDVFIDTVWKTWLKGLHRHIKSV